MAKRRGIKLLKNPQSSRASLLNYWPLSPPSATSGQETGREDHVKEITEDRPRLSLSLGQEVVSKVEWRSFLQFRNSLGLAYIRMMGEVNLLVAYFKVDWEHAIQTFLVTPQYGYRLLWKSGVLTFSCLQ